MSATSASPHPLADYDLKAVLDWIEVRVTLAEPSQPRHVRARMRAVPRWATTPPHVRPCTDDSSGTSSSFIVRVQDPPPPAQLLADVQAIRRAGDPPLTEEDIEVLAVEIALDAYPRTPEARADLAGAAAYLWTRHASPPAGTTRICRDGKRDRSEVDFRPEHIRRALAEGWAINCGDRGAPHTSRHYVKTYDSRDGDAYAPLPEADYRARAEITLRGGRRPFRTITGWRCYDFAKLAPMFALRRVIDTEAPSPLLALLRDQTRHGRPTDPEKQAGHRRTHRKDTAADTTANERIRAALRALARRHQGARSRNRSA